MRGNDELEGIGEIIDKLQQEAVEKYKKEHGWIPCSERMPESDKYILISCSNYTGLCIGRYEKHEDGSGNFYQGDDDDTLLSYGLFVNAWMPLPEPYREE